MIYLLGWGSARRDRAPGRAMIASGVVPAGSRLAVQPLSCNLRLPRLPGRCEPGDRVITGAPGRTRMESRSTAGALWLAWPPARATGAGEPAGFSAPPCPEVRALPQPIPRDAAAWRPGWAST